MKRRCFISPLQDRDSSRAFIAAGVLFFDGGWGISSLHLLSSSHRAVVANDDVVDLKRHTHTKIIRRLFFSDLPAITAAPSSFQNKRFFCCLKEFIGPHDHRISTGGDVDEKRSKKFGFRFPFLFCVPPREAESECGLVLSYRRVRVVGFVIQSPISLVIHVRIELSILTSMMNRVVIDQP